MQNHLSSYGTNGLDFAADRRVGGIIDEILSEKKFLLLLQGCTAACPDLITGTQVRSSTGSRTAVLGHPQDAHECWHQQICSGSSLAQAVEGSRCVRCAQFCVNFSNTAVRNDFNIKCQFVRTAALDTNFLRAGWAIVVAGIFVLLKEMRINL